MHFLVAKLPVLSIAVMTYCGYSQGFSRKETSNDSGVARRAQMLPSHAEVYLLCA